MPISAADDVACELVLVPDVVEEIVVDELVRLLDNADVDVISKVDWVQGLVVTGDVVILVLKVGLCLDVKTVA